MYNLTDLQGDFTSPNYPFSYPNNLDCLWTITVTPGYYIHLNFSNFSLEGTYGLSFCPYDYVEVSDLNYSSSSIKIQRCGYQSPWCVLSTSNVLHVRFVSDVIIPSSGFKAQYESSKNYVDENCLSLNITNTTNLQPTKGTKLDLKNRYINIYIFKFSFHKVSDFKAALSFPKVTHSCHLFLTSSY